MKIGVLGTGMVGRTIASKLVELGHEVRLGAREAANDKAATWAREARERASHGTFADAAAFGEVLFNCTLGSASIEALARAGAENLRGKVLVDVSNPLEFPPQGPPAIAAGTPAESLGERIQRAFPEAKVVKALNTVNRLVMVDPSRVPGDHDMLISGDDAAAKTRVTEILREFGWRHVVDLGDITTARSTESYVALWIRLRLVLGTGDFNIHVARA